MMRALVWYNFSMNFLCKNAKHAVNITAFLAGLGTAAFSLSRGVNYVVAGTISLVVVIGLVLLFNLIADKVGFEKVDSLLWWPL